MLSILDPNTVPQNYHSILKKYTSKGFRVLSIGSAEIPAHFKSLSRVELEANLHFDGFEVF